MTKLRRAYLKPSTAAPVAGTTQSMPGVDEFTRRATHAHAKQTRNRIGQRRTAPATISAANPVNPISVSNPVENGLCPSAYFHTGAKIMPATNPTVTVGGNVSSRYGKTL